MEYKHKSAALRTKAPKLADWQKDQLVALMDKYFQMRKTLFYYTGSARRENYAFESNASAALGYGSDLNNSCMYIDGQGRYRYLINCGVFCQFIWMGRKVEDFISGETAGETALRAYLEDNSEAPAENMLTEQPTITRTITTALKEDGENGKKWGYYFDFELSRKCFKAARTNVNGELEYFAYNSFYQPNLEAERQTKYPDLRVPLGFDGASAMAEELFRKGYEVHFDEMDVGDMVFFTSDVSDDYRNPPDAEDDDPMTGKVFRRITHVGLVYGFSNGKPIIMDSSDAYEGVLSMGRTSMDIEYNEDGTPKTDNFVLCKTANLLNNIVMVARHPAAFGDKKPMPENFGFYRGIDVPNKVNMKNYTPKTGPFDGAL